jgi:hypothetical protein
MKKVSVPRSEKIVCILDDYSLDTKRPLYKIQSYQKNKLEISNIYLCLK